MLERFLICLVTCLLAACASKPPVAEPVVERVPPPGTVEMAPVAQPPAPVRLVDADNIFFGAGSTEINAAERNKLQAHAERLKADPRQVVTLVGNTDDQGSRSYKLAIAQGRVDAVFAALRRLGVPARQMQRYPVGREKMLAGCATAECRKTMRRVELVYRP